ncbi:uncharacterized protein LOC131155858 [Malania oleifera]|uniref:uncharacterized protein LOC131155858 n=1 Tax=Malania oleifera TaxID=397392 RepID=UPI0025AE7C3F|nr:uncharacterized protein LOC131155858 [Malania oleifera]
MYDSEYWLLEDDFEMMDLRGKNVAAEGEYDLEASSKEDFDTSMMLQGQDCSIKDFMRLNPSNFVGGPDLVVAENWVQEIEEIMTVLGCRDKQKFLYATFKMTGDARQWWLSVKLLKEWRLVKIALTWDRFKELFFDRYFPLSTREKKIQEFTNLTQGSMTVGEYVAKLVELSRFALFLIPNEAKRARKFEKGLRRRVYKFVVGFKVQNLSHLVDKASVLEKSIQGGTELTEQMKRPAPSSFQIEGSKRLWKRGKDTVGPRQDIGD